MFHGIQLDSQWSLTLTLRLPLMVTPGFELWSEMNLEEHWLK